MQVSSNYQSTTNPIMIHEGNSETSIICNIYTAVKHIKTKGITRITEVNLSARACAHINLQGKMFSRP